MVADHYLPERGDIVWLDFDPQSGHEQSGRRPALVLSPALYNERSGLCIICPITSQYKPYPFLVPLGESLLPKTSYALADQIKSVDWRARHAVLIARAPSWVLKQVAEYAAGIVLGSA